eukprot:TRINITY_DN2222_c0_g1_i2.p2 TRINITY_DN2222_c0_g1~~TRINITY_DN2222_c0_g1_i2.p2  ORF type:complete len:391 (+),score=63.29 TRINITY_DN2222_c0_g1_i2:1194-2366(+)
MDDHLEYYTSSMFHNLSEDIFSELARYTKLADLVSMMACCKSWNAFRFSEKIGRSVLLEITDGQPRVVSSYWQEIRNWKRIGDNWKSQHCSISRITVQDAEQHFRCCNIRLDASPLLYYVYDTKIRIHNVQSQTTKEIELASRLPGRKSFIRFLDDGWFLISNFEIFQAVSASIGSPDNSIHELALEIEEVCYDPASKAMLATLHGSADVHILSRSNGYRKAEAMGLRQKYTRISASCINNLFALSRTGFIDVVNINSREVIRSISTSDVASIGRPIMSSTFVCWMSVGRSLHWLPLSILNCTSDDGQLIKPMGIPTNSNCIIQGEFLVYVSLSSSPQLVMIRLHDGEEDVHYFPIDQSEAVAHDDKRIVLWGRSGVITTISFDIKDPKE